MMKIKIARYILTIQVIISCFAFESAAFNDSEASAYLWKLINEARSRPLKTIEAYGIDHEIARRALGEDMWILELENGLPPLAWHGTLSESASAHNNDMINRRYYSYTSPEEVSFNERITNSGYDALLTGEILGILSFYIYVDPVKAVEGIFENMLRDELNPELGYAKNIFNKDFTEIGISFISTAFSISKDSILNAYLVTADFAKPVEVRNYVFGNIYNIGENKPEILVWSKNDATKKEYVKNLLSYSGWSPEKANDNFILRVNNLTQGWSFEVPHGSLASYQIQIPANTFYSIEVFDINQESLLKRIINIGLNVNKMVDFTIN
ncbi:MAG: hypothetical protein HQK61_01865 [Desulfamplus sp.]|nr:hypothetical protein [Desulfamplus sp.]